MSGSPGFLVKQASFTNFFSHILGMKAEDEKKLQWILTTSFQDSGLSRNSFLKSEHDEKTLLIEIGPR